MDASGLEGGTRSSTSRATDSLRRRLRHPFREGLTACAVTLLVIGSILTTQGWTTEQDLAREYGPPTACGSGLNCTVADPLQGQPAYGAAHSMLLQGLLLLILGILFGVAALAVAIGIRRDEEPARPFDPGQW
jgi:hypothetical protein